MTATADDPIHLTLGLEPRYWRERRARAVPDADDLVGIPALAPEAEVEHGESANTSELRRRALAARAFRPAESPLRETVVRLVVLTVMLWLVFAAATALAFRVLSVL